MIVKQLSVFLENKLGRLTELTKVLAEHDINISAFSIADGTDYGIIRCIVGRPELAYTVLKEHKFSVTITDVACLIVPHKPGGLYHALQIISNNNISIDYMYAFAAEHDAVVVIRTESTQELIQILQDNKLELLRSGDIYQI
ncbi:MAG TPA: ACT domain-containing protein [Bacteroidales bacterium]|nr:ACT domain-containing protein [Bacteroidales bacterium]